MITAEQAKQYLDSQGVDTGAIPEFILDAWVDTANSINACLDEHYPASVALLIQCYLISLIAFAQSDGKYISSQTGPNGASRSIKIRDFDERWKAQSSLLKGLDKHGCSFAVMPTDPTVTAFGGLWVSKGSCGCGG
ncbi:hypothetical protein C4G95_RS18475 [Vibrio parahaemolyticus]|nr:hypothetical protein [Vibrio parahaemolyticus]